MASEIQSSLGGVMLMDDTLPEAPENEPETRRKAPRGMPMDEFASIIAAEIEAAKEGERTDYTKDRERALNYYLGRMPDTPTRPHRSKAMSRDVADTVGWILPGLMRVFTGGDKVVEYVPTEPGDEEFAAQATDFINFQFMSRCNGYRVLWDAFHDALVMRNGIVKFYRDNQPVYNVEKYRGLDPEAYQLVVGTPDTEVLAQTENVVMVEGPEGEPVESVTYDIKTRVKVRDGEIRVVSVPPEEFLIDVDATCIDDARFLCHRTDKTRSDLIAEGYPRHVIDDLPVASISVRDDTPEALARHEDFITGTSPHKMHASMEYVEVFESYVLLDFDGDGEAEWMRCVMAGGMSEENILAYEEWDDPIPFAEFIPARIPHRWQGRSVADDTMDVQQIKTTLLRESLDNLYAVNNPQKIVNANMIENPDEVINPQFNGVVRVRGNPGEVFMPLTMPFVAGNSFQMLSYLDDMLEKRTGVSRSTMALDPNTLQNQSATAAQLQHDASYSKTELIARNFAEEGLKKLFGGLLKLYVKYQQRAETIRLRGQFVTMDPRQWNADMDVSISVGLGSGSRDRDLATLQQILTIQQMVLERLGPGNPIAGPVEISNTLEKLVKAAGLKNVEQYFKPVTPEVAQQMAQAAQNQTDPKVEAMKQKAEADMQIAQMKAQSEAQLGQMKLQADVQMQQAKAEADSQVAQGRLEAEMRLAEAKASAEIELRRAEMQERLQIEREKMRLAHEARLQEMALETELKRAQIMMGINTPGDEGNVARPQ